MKLRRQVKRCFAIEPLECRRLLALNPTPLEQETLQLANRFRTDPANEYARLIKSSSPIQSHDAEVTSNLTFFKVDANLLRSELSSLSPSPPLAWNEVIQNLATTQNGTMISKNSQEHFPGLAATLNAMGVPIEAGTGQNAFYNNLGIGKTPFFVHSAYVIDWGTGGTGGMQPNRGHRVNMLNPLYNQVGSAITPFSSSLVSTQFFAKVSSAQKMAVGAIFEDRNDTGWYEAGEGIGGVQVVFEGSAGRFTTTSMSAGGYQIVLPAGTYSVTASGGGMKHSITQSNVTIGASNVWQNLIYDPSAIPPDAREPNNTTAAATDLGSSDQTIASLSIHPGDVDFFKVTAAGTGSATFTLRFTQANGNLDLNLLNANGTVIASSISSNSPETITANLVRGQSYFVQVFSSSSATNGDYSLQLNLPEPAAPVAVADRAITAQGAGLVRVQITANDTDADSPNSALVPVMQTAGTGSFVIETDRSLSYRPPTNYTGIDRATYRVTDEQGQASNNATIEIFVLDFADATPWRHARRHLGVNDDGVVSPLDALLVINEMTARGSRSLPTSVTGATGMYGFVDTSGSNSIEALDALLVINELNRIRRGNGEGEAAMSDAALSQMFPDDSLDRRKQKRDVN